jgi:hypothetical protein
LRGGEKWVNSLFEYLLGKTACRKRVKKPHGKSGGEKNESESKRKRRHREKAFAFNKAATFDKCR